jgi:hypothetical protein
MRSPLLLLGISLSVASLLLTENRVSAVVPTQPPSPTPAPSPMTTPGLWWAKEQFGGDTLDSWLTYPGNGTTPGRIDLLVNPQSWSSLDYIQRYVFVNHFGTVARRYGYNVRVFDDPQKELLAAYTCNFGTTPHLCSIQLQATGKGNSLSSI